MKGMRNETAGALWTGQMACMKVPSLVCKRCLWARMKRRVRVSKWRH